MPLSRGLLCQDAILALATTFDLDTDDVIPTSAKTGEGIAEVSACERWREKSKYMDRRGGGRGRGTGVNPFHA